MSTLIYLFIILFAFLGKVQAQEFTGPFFSEPRVTPLLMVGNRVLSPTSIRFHLQDVSDSETGYVIHDKNENVLASSGPDPFPAWLEAENLRPDTYYCQIHAHVVKSGALSPPSEEFPCVHTFAIVPDAPKVLKVEPGSVTLALENPGNPAFTKYRIEEVRRELWANTDGVLSAQPVSKTISEWGGDGGVRLIGLMVGAYEFRAYAKNGDGFLTDPSSIIAVTIETTGVVPTPSVEEMEYQPPQIIGPPKIPPQISPAPGISPDQPILAPTSTPEISIPSAETPTGTLFITSTTEAVIIPEQSINKVLAMVSKNIAEFRKLTIDNPDLERLNLTVVVPALEGGATITGAATLTLPNLFPYLRYLFSQPLLLFWRKKRKNWGIIYNAVTKLPLDLAVARLVDARTGRIVQTRVTDRAGRYIFITKPGKYKIGVNKKQYVFPTTILKNKETDLRYLDLYDGDIFSVSEEKTAVAKNIPLDPAIKSASWGWLIFEKIGRKIQYIGATSSVIAALASLAINPSAITLFLTATHVIILAFFVRLARGVKPKDLGKVMDAKTKKGLSLAIVRIFDIEYNKLLQTALTDLRGRYTFLVGENVYYVQAEKAGYKSKQTQPIDFSKKREPSAVSQDIMLERQNIP